MRRARLLHSPEKVEVLHIDARTGIAIILRHGFEQRVPLQDIVLDEEERQTSALQVPPAAQSGELEITLRPRPAENKAELHIHYGYSLPSFCVLYIQTAQRTWKALLSQRLACGEAASLMLSLEEYPPPWTLLMQRLELPETAVAAPPVLHSSEITVRLATFMREGVQKLFPEGVAHTPQKNPEMSEYSPSAPIIAAPEIDLHIEALAPGMKNSPAEVIFGYQVQCMKRYLYACESARQPSAVVIHGVGRKRLQAVLVELCKAEGWRVEPLLTPPYLGGASRVYFS